MIVAVFGENTQLLEVGKEAFFDREIGEKVARVVGQT
jgi:hypothetical protein